jgi:hypothetical protein
MSEPKGWHMSEDLGLGIVNPQAVCVIEIDGVRLTMPPWMWMSIENSAKLGGLDSEEYVRITLSSLGDNPKGWSVEDITRTFGFYSDLRETS